MIKSSEEFLNIVYKKKEEEIKKAKELRNELLALLYRALIDNYSLFTFKIKVKQICTNIEIFNLVVAIYIRARKRIKEKKLYPVEIAAFLVLNTNLFAFNELNKKINELARRNEEKRKNDFLFSFFSRDYEYSNIEKRRKKDPFYFKSEKRKEKNDNLIFFLCSFHEDSASDHEDYQGKIYIDKNWRKKIKVKEQVSQIELYIYYNDPLSIQSVCFSSPYLITRPNCRHFIKAIDTNRVLTQNVGNILLAEKMYFKEGKIEEKNRRNELENYIDRESYHKKICEVSDNELTRKALKKDRYLIYKFKNM